MSRGGSRVSGCNYFYRGPQFWLCTYICSSTLHDTNLTHYLPTFCETSKNSFWRYGFQTNWDLSTVADVEDYDVSCAIKTGIETRENTFMLNNHFSNNRLGLPSQGIAEIINAKEFLQNRLEACTEIVGRRTNLLAVDFWSIGDVVDVVNINNAALPEGEIVFDNIFED